MVYDLRRSVELLLLSPLLLQSWNEGACPVCSVVVELCYHACESSAERLSKIAKAELSGFHAQCSCGPRQNGQNGLWKLRGQDS